VRPDQQAYPERAADLALAGHDSSDFPDELQKPRT